MYRAEFKRRVSKSRSTAQKRIDASDDFFQVIRLYDIVIGARVETLHFLMPIAACGQDQYWKGSPCPTKLFDQGDSVDFWQPQINDRRIVVIFCSVVEPIAAIRRGIHNKSVLN